MRALRKYLLGLIAIGFAAVIPHAVFGWDLGAISLALFVGWPPAGTLITIDDDLPGGWSNPDGKSTSEWKTTAWWANILLCRGAMVPLYIAYEVRADESKARQLVAAAVAMLAVGFPIFLKVLRSNYASNS